MASAARPAAASAPAASRARAGSSMTPRRRCVGYVIIGRAGTVRSAPRPPQGLDVGRGVAQLGRGPHPCARRAAAGPSGSTPASPTAGTGGRPGGRRRGPGAPRPRVISRALACGLANAATTSLIGPHGMSAAPRTSAQSEVDRVANREARIGRRSARLTTRSPLVAKRASRGEARQPDRLAQPRPLALAADGNRQLAVRRAERLVRDEVRVGVAHPARRGPADERVLRLVDEHRQRRLEQRDVDPLAAAGPARVGRSRRPGRGAPRARTRPRTAR